MKLLIDVSEEDYKECIFRKDLLSLGGEPTDLTFNMRMEKLIANGTPLPDRQGRLMILSEDKMKENQINLDFSAQKWISEVGLSNAIVKIVEADKENKE